MIIKEKSDKFEHTKIMVYQKTQLREWKISHRVRNLSVTHRNDKNSYQEYIRPPTPQQKSR